MSTSQIIATSCTEQLPLSNNHSINPTNKLSNTTNEAEQLEKDSLIKINDVRKNKKEVNEGMEKLDLACPVCEMVFESKLLLIHHTRYHALADQMNPQQLSKQQPSERQQQQISKQQHSEQQQNLNQLKPQLHQDCLQHKVDTQSKVERLSQQHHIDINESLQKTTKTTNSLIFDKTEIQSTTASTKHKRSHSSTKNKCRLKGDGRKMLNDEKRRVISACGAVKGTSRGKHLDVNHPFYCKVSTFKFEMFIGCAISYKTFILFFIYFLFINLFVC